MNCVGELRIRHLQRMRGKSLLWLEVTGQSDAEMARVFRFHDARARLAPT
jgi:hypothetical protein